MRTNRLFRLLDAELVDAEDDIRDLERTLKERNEAQEITNYVFRENTVLLEQELHGIERIRAGISALDPEAYVDTETFVEEITSLVREYVQHHGVPGAVESIVGRRLHRLVAYVSQEF